MLRIGQYKQGFGDEGLYDQIRGLKWLGNVKPHVDYPIMQILLQARVVNQLKVDLHLGVTRPKFAQNGGQAIGTQRFSRTNHQRSAGDFFIGDG
jgi:hypothetical protein